MYTRNMDLAMNLGQFNVLVLVIMDPRGFAQMDRSGFQLRRLP